MELLQCWQSLYGLRYAPITLIQVVTSAGLVYLLSAMQAASGLRVGFGSLKHFLTQAELCVEYLREIGKSWQCATNIAEILRNLLQQQLNPILESRSLDRNAVLAAGPTALHTLPPKPLTKTSQKHSNASSTEWPTPSLSSSQSGNSSVSLQVPTNSVHSSHTWADPVSEQTSLSWINTDTSVGHVVPGQSTSYATYIGMETTGMLGIPGGDMISEAPVIPFGMLDSSDGSAMHRVQPFGDQEMQEQKTEDSDFAVLQQFLMEQPNRMHELFATHN